MKYQFEGFAEGDRVRITRPSDHYEAGATYEGVLDFYVEGCMDDGEDTAQLDLLMDNGEQELLESGPGAWDIFAFTSIEKVEA